MKNIRLTLTTLLIIYQNIALAEEPLYQIDMVIFTNPKYQTKELLSKPLLAPDTSRAITLASDTTSSTQPFNLMPDSNSLLAKEISLLQQERQHQILFQFSWLQPENNKKAIHIPKIISNNWEVMGVIKVTHNNYYEFNADVLFSSPQSSPTSFLFTQTQRMRADTNYYFDHPNLGMIVRIHPVAETI